MRPEQYIGKPKNKGIYEYMFPMKHRWIMDGAIVRDNEPEIFADIAGSFCFVFVGERGYGKRTIISAFASTACIKNNYDYLEVPVIDFFSETCSPAESINEFFDIFNEEITESSGKPKIFVYFDGTEILIKYPTLCTRFMGRIRQLMKTDNAHIIFAISFRNKAADLPPVFFSDTHIFELSLPDENKRYDFLSERFSGIAKICDGLTVDELVKKTKGLSYGELARFSDELLMLIKGKYLDENDLNDFSEKNISLGSDFICPLYYETLCDDIRKISSDISSVDTYNSLAEAIADLVRFGSPTIGNPMIVSSGIQTESTDGITADNNITETISQDMRNEQADNKLGERFNVEEELEKVLPNI